MATIDARSKAEPLVERIRQLVSEGKAWQQIVFDPEVNAVDSKAFWVEAVILAMKLSNPTYLRATDKPVAETKVLGDSEVTVDLDESGNVVGVELLVDCEIERKESDDDCSWSCDLRRCGSGTFSGGIGVHEDIGDASYQATICFECAKALGLKAGDALPDALTVERTLRAHYGKESDEPNPI